MNIKDKLDNGVLKICITNFPGIADATGLGVTF